MRIYVNQKDIDSGKPRNSEACPIANALKRRFPKAYIHVGGPAYDYKVKVGYRDKEEVYYLTKRGGDLVRDFDKGFSILPTHVTLSRRSYIKREKWQCVVY